MRVSKIPVPAGSEYPFLISSTNIFDIPRKDISKMVFIPIERKLQPVISSNRVHNHVEKPFLKFLNDCEYMLSKRVSGLLTKDNNVMVVPG